MIKRTVLLLMFTLCAVACIHVVVNVYFPESEAKGALANLEDELLKPPPPKAPEAPPEPPKPEQAPVPQSRLLRWFQPATAYAAGSVSEEQIYQQIKSMPQVLQAYQRMGARLNRVNALRSSGVVGEGKDGLLAPRGTVTDRREQKTIDDENADRAVVIRGLAKASLAAQGQGVTEEAINQVLPDAAATFAALRREKAERGWWIQLPDGTWTRK